MHRNLEIIVVDDVARHKLIRSVKVTSLFDWPITTLAAKNIVNCRPVACAFFGTSALDETTHRLVAAEFAKQTREPSSPSGFVGPSAEV
jgi:hypothetical protein